MTGRKRQPYGSGGAVRLWRRAAVVALVLLAGLLGSSSALAAPAQPVVAGSVTDSVNMSGALATAGNLVFLGHYDGTISAHDAKTLAEVWTFNIGTGINAPLITFAINGKQYLAVLAGSAMREQVLGTAPELRNNATASMLYVFTL